MKTDLFSSIGLAIAGTLIAYFVCNMFFSEIESYSFKTVDSSVSTELAEPNPEVFNYKALDPTVEVYVGDCNEGDCKEVTSDGVIDIGVDSNTGSDNGSDSTNSESSTNQGNSNTQRNP